MNEVEWKSFRQFTTTALRTGASRVKSINRSLFTKTAALAMLTPKCVTGPTLPAKNAACPIHGNIGGDRRCGNIFAVQAGAECPTSALLCFWFDRPHLVVDSAKNGHIKIDITSFSAHTNCGRRAVHSNVSIEELRSS